MQKARQPAGAGAGVPAHQRRQCHSEDETENCERAGQHLTVVPVHPVGPRAWRQPGSARPELACNASYVAKRTDELGRAYKQSQLQMQLYVSRRASALTAAVLDALPSLAELRPILTWVSPLEVENFAEYHDADFLRAISRPELAAVLADYWPPGGPHWDALAIARDADGHDVGPVLVEAKSWPGEMRSRTTASEASRKRIAERLSETRHWLGIGEEHAQAWLERYYQAANRYAYLRWFVDVLGERAWLANIFFIDDPDKPTSRASWDTAIAEAATELGLEGLAVPNTWRVFLPAGERDELLASPK